jgi:hypothetical protein
MSWAPFELDIKSNTSCQTDEFLAHHIGLIPFKRVGNGDTMSLSATGPCVVLSGDVIGPAFEAVFDNIEVIRLAQGQCVDLTLHFDLQAASKHARYSMCAAIGMEKEGANNRLRFERIDGGAPQEAFLDALLHFERRVDRALLALSHQPITPPTSMC